MYLTEFPEHSIKLIQMCNILILINSHNDFYFYVCNASKNEAVIYVSINTKYESKTYESTAFIELCNINDMLLTGF